MGFSSEYQNNQHACCCSQSQEGSGRAAILKHVVANNKVDAAKAATQVRLSLKRGVAKGENAGSYKLVKVVKPKKVKKAKKVVKKKAAKKAKKPAAKKAAKKPAKKAAPKKKPAAKKAPKKKAAPKK